MCLPDYKKIIETQYDEFHDKLYENHTGVPKATIIFEITEVEDSGYDWKGKIIYIRLPEGNLEDFQEKEFQ